MRIAFTTLQHIESDFYGRVGRHLGEAGHQVSHVAYSRRAARKLKRLGPAFCLPELMQRVTPSGSFEAEGERIVRDYGLPNLRDVYKTDLSYRKSADETFLVERTVRHFLAFERLFVEIDPEVVIPEVGSETMRTVAHLVGQRQGRTVLFLMYTMFENPLRLYANTMHAPIVDDVEVRELSEAEETELDGFIERFAAKAKPIRDYRAVRVSGRRARLIARHLAVKAVYDRDNEYLTPGAWLVRDLREKVRAAGLRSLYEPAPSGERPFVYFPLHVTDDYKILRLIPHCVHQEGIIKQVADALPHGYDLVIKEHPMSIGRNSFAMLRRLAKVSNIKLVSPYTSSHQLIKDAAAISVISSTVGLEALLYNRPVMTLGQPFYSGYGVTVDVDSFREIPRALPRLLGFEPDPERTRQFLHAAMRHCHPGAPMLVDRSDENARTLASTLHRAVSGQLEHRDAEPSLV